MRATVKRLAPLGNGTHCHILIAKTAKEMAGVVYEELMHDNSRYAAWKEMCPELTPKLAEAEFIKHMWPHLIEQARATLARMLAMPYPEGLKNDIHHALILDASLRRGRTRSEGFRLSPQAGPSHKTALH